MRFLLTRLVFVFRVLTCGCHPRRVFKLLCCATCFGFTRQKNNVKLQRSSRCRRLDVFGGAWKSENNTQRKLMNHILTPNPLCTTCSRPLSSRSRWAFLQSQRPPTKKNDCYWTVLQCFNERSTPDAMVYPSTPLGGREENRRMSACHNWVVTLEYVFWLVDEWAGSS